MCYDNETIDFMWVNYNYPLYCGSEVYCPFNVLGQYVYVRIINNSGLYYVYDINKNIICLPTFKFNIINCDINNIINMYRNLRDEILDKINERNNEINNLNEIISEKDDMIKMLRSELSEKNKLIESLISDNNEMKNSHEIEISLYDEQVNVFKSEITEKNTLINNLNEKIITLESVDKKIESDLIVSQVKENSEIKNFNNIIILTEQQIADLTEQQIADLMVMFSRYKMFESKKNINDSKLYDILSVRIKQGNFDINKKVTGWKQLVFPSDYIYPNNYSDPQNEYNLYKYKCGFFLFEPLNDVSSLLIIATHLRFFKTIDLLINNGANIDFIANDGWTAFHSAVRLDEENLCRKLITKNTFNNQHFYQSTNKITNTISKKSSTPLSIAISNLYVNSARIIVDFARTNNINLKFDIQMFNRIYTMDFFEKTIFPISLCMGKVTQEYRNATIETTQYNRNKILKSFKFHIIYLDGSEEVRHLNDNDLYFGYDNIFEHKAACNENKRFMYSNTYKISKIYGYSIEKTFM